jgi:transposase InsO family protein
MKRHTEELKNLIGDWLARDADRGALKVLSQSLKVSPKTLNNWKRGSCRRKGGRPRYTTQQRSEALKAVAKELRRQGYPGEKAVENALPHVPLRLIREYVSLIKARRRMRMAARARSVRKSVRVKATGVILAQDGAHLGRSKKGPVDAQIIKDRASLKIIKATVGPPTEEHVLSTLQMCKEEGRLPLVWSTDNGSAYVTPAVAEYLEREKIIHLRNLPRTPQHNASVERAVRELKEASALGKGARVSEEEACVALKRAVNTVNSSRYRMGGWDTASVLDESLPTAYNLLNRDLFYADCKQAMCEARLTAVNVRAERMAKRDAIYATLEKYGLVEMTTGGK